MKRKKKQIFPYEAYCLFVLAEMFLEVTLFFRNLLCPEKLLVACLVYHHGLLTNETFGF